MESKIIDYGKILLQKYKVEQIEVIYRLLFTFSLTNCKNTYIFLIHFHASFTVTTSRVIIQSYFESIQSKQ